MLPIDIERWESDTMGALYRQLSYSTNDVLNKLDPEKKDKDSRADAEDFASYIRSKLRVAYND